MFFCSARLNETQEKYYGYEAKTLEKQRLIDNEGNIFELFIGSVLKIFDS